MDIGQLAQVVYAEVRTALVEIIDAYRRDQLIQLSKVRIRLGEPARLANNNDSGSTHTERLIPPETGWAVDITFDPYRDGAQILSPPEQQSVDLVIYDRLFDNDTLDRIQGVGHHWQQVLQRLGYERIGQLAAMTDESMQTLCQQQSSRLPIEFRSKARITQTALPSIRNIQLKHDTLYDLAILTKQQLIELYGDDLPERQAEQLVEFLGLMSMAMTEDHLTAITVANLIERNSE